MDTKNMIGKINEPKRWFLEKTNKIDKLLARLIKRKGEKVQRSALGRSYKCQQLEAAGYSQISYSQTP